MVDRLGDSRDTVREKAQLLLAKLLESHVLQPQQLLDKLTPCFKHKNAKIREEFLYTITETLNLYVSLPLSNQRKTKMHTNVFLHTYFVLDMAHNRCRLKHTFSRSFCCSAIPHRRFAMPPFRRWLWSTNMSVSRHIHPPHPIYNECVSLADRKAGSVLCTFCRHINCICSMHATHVRLQKRW